MAGTADGAVQEPSALTHSVQTMARVLLRDESVTTVLQLVATLARAAMRHVDGVGASLVQDGRVRAEVLDDELARRFADAHPPGDDPVLDVVEDGRPVVLRSPDGKGGSSDSKPTAVAGAAGIGAAMIVPLAVEGETIGTLNLFSRRRDGFADEQRALATEFASYASVLLTNAADYADATELGTHLREAVRTRDLIGQAKGILMAKRRCSPDEAFELLRDLSQATNIKLREVARTVVETAQTTGEPVGGLDEPPDGRS